MGARCLLLALASGLAPAGAAETQAAARSEAEVDTQQECEYAAARVEALQTKSALTVEPAGGAADEAVAVEEQGAAAQPTPAVEETEELSEEGPLYAGMDGNPWAPGPNIYLASLVDQGNYRGYCLDIVGSPPHPQCNTIQAHTCKDEGEDTQFKYEPGSNLIRALNFNSQCNPLYSGSKNGREWEADTDPDPACLTVLGDFENGKYQVSLRSCYVSNNGTMQSFFHTSEGQFQVGNTRFCLVLGNEVTDMYLDFYMRSLEIQECTEWPKSLSQWEVLLPDHSRFGWTSDSSQTE